MPAMSRLSTSREPGLGSAGGVEGVALVCKANYAEIVRVIMPQAGIAGYGRRGPERSLDSGHIAPWLLFRPEQAT
jgi:hypothetical protein